MANTVDSGSSGPPDDITTWRTIPTDVLDAEKSSELADSWAADERAKMADQWKASVYASAPAAPAPAPTSPTSGGGPRYTVRPGDTLSDISRRMFGDSSLAGWLAQQNGIADPNVIQAGQQLTIPNTPARQQTTFGQDARDTRAAGGGSYVVAPGDTLSAIGQRYGVPYQQIAQASGISNPDLIHPGQRLAIPGGNTTRQPAPSPPVSATTGVTGGAGSGPLQDYARQAAINAGIDPNVFVRQIQQESGFNPNAVSPAGARGVAQIVPRWHPGVNPDDPKASLDYAANLMASNLRQYGDMRMALVAYNGGGGAVNAWKSGQPYDESMRYVNAILGGATGDRPATEAAAQPQPAPVSQPTSVQDLKEGSGPADRLDAASARVVSRDEIANLPNTSGQWLQLATSQIGKPYVWGSAGGRSDFSDNPAGYDCSGFVGWVARNGFGVNLPAFTGDIYKSTESVPFKDVQPGDLVMFNMNQGDPHLQHVGIYIGDGKMIHASTFKGQNGVQITPVWGGQSAEFRHVPGVNLGAQPSTADNQGAAPPADNPLQGAINLLGQTKDKAGDAAQSFVQAVQNLGDIVGGVGGALDTRGQQIQAAAQSGNPGAALYGPREDFTKPLAPQTQFDVYGELSRSIPEVAAGVQSGDWGRALVGVLGTLSAGASVLPGEGALSAARRLGGATGTAATEGAAQAAEGLTSAQAQEAHQLVQDARQALASGDIPKEQAPQIQQLADQLDARLSRPAAAPPTPVAADAADRLPAAARAVPDDALGNAARSVEQVPTSDMAVSGTAGPQVAEQLPPVPQKPTVRVPVEDVPTAPAPSNAQLMDDALRAIQRNDANPAGNLEELEKIDKQISSGEKGAPATSGAEQAAPTASTAARVAALREDPAYLSARPLDQVQMLEDALNGREAPPAQRFTAAGTEVNPGTGQPLTGGQGIYGPTELGGSPIPAVSRAISGIWAPAERAPQSIQDALNVLDEQVRGSRSRIDTLRRQLAADPSIATSKGMTPDALNKIYDGWDAGLRSQGVSTFLQDVANSTDGVRQKWAPGPGLGGGGPRAPQVKPTGWTNGETLAPQLQNVWLSPEVATVVKNTLGQNDSVPLLSGLANIAGLPKELEMGGSPFHTISEAKNVLATNGLVDGSRILKTGVENMASQEAYDRFRLAAAPSFERWSRAGVTQLQDAFEGEGADAFNKLATTLRTYPVRTVMGAVGGAVRGGVEYGPGGAVAGGVLGGVEGALSVVVSPALWQRFIPTIKLMTAEQLGNTGMADQAVARAVNTMFGGENKVRIAQAAWTSTLARVTAFAPDWWASEVKTIGGALGKGDPSEVALARKVVISRIFYGELLHEGMNWALTGGPWGGHFSWQNAPDHEMDVETMALKPTSDQKEPQQNFIDGRIFFDPRDYDLLKLATNAIAGGQGGDAVKRFIGNRLSVPLAQTAEQGANTTRVGLGVRETPITKSSESPGEQFLRRAAQAANILAPAGATTPIESFQQTGPVGGLASALTGGRMTSESEADIYKHESERSQQKPPWQGLADALHLQYLTSSGPVRRSIGPNP